MKPVRIAPFLFASLASLLVTAVVAAEAPREVIVKARVDAASELVVTTNGFRWKNGMYAKPGRHDGRNEPTYINDVPWLPKWTKPAEERGVDTSDEFPFHFENLDLDFELLAVGDSANATNVEVRSAPTISQGANSLIINIPDPEWGSKWYIFALTQRTAPTNAPAAK